MAQLAQCLPCEHEDLSSLPRTHVKKLGVMKRTYDPSPGNAETEGFLDLIGLVRDPVSRATEKHG